MAVDYWAGFLKRRWPLMVGIIGIVVIAAGVLAFRDYRHRPWVSTAQLFVGAVRVPGSGSGPAQLVAEEHAAALMARDLAAVMTSGTAAAQVRPYLEQQGVNKTGDQIQSATGATSLGRTITVTALESSQTDANAVARAIIVNALRFRARLLGRWEAAHGAPRIIASPRAIRDGLGHVAASAAVRVILGIVVAVALALAWEYLDDTVHSPEDLEQALGAPLLGRVK